MTWAVRLALLVAVSLAACTRDETLQPETLPGPLPAEGSVAVDFRTDKTVYVVGGAAKTTMVNRSPDTFTMGVCNDALEWESSAGWAEVRREILPCVALALVIAPGDSATLGLDLRGATVPGTYRVRRHFSVVHGSSSETQYRRSNTFTIVR